MRLALVSDAWAPQVNGVVRTLTATVTELRRRGHEVVTLTPDLFRTIPCPTYPEIRLAMGSAREVAGRLAAADVDAVHIATEGPLGWAARRWCLRVGQPFTTSFHTRFPDYVAMRTGLPSRWFWPVVRQFHRPAARIMVATDRLAAELRAQGLPQSHRWSRGVDLAQFTPAAATAERLTWAGLPRPIQLYVGRVAVEKNLAAFLAAETRGSKVVVGDGPARQALVERYPDACFPGMLHGRALAAAYAAADVLVFPSLTDTFGLVMIEALACGTPVAAFPVAGPLDVLGEQARGRRGRPIGALDHDIVVAIGRALAASPADCVAEASGYGWSACTDQFVAGLAPQRPAMALAA